MAHFTWSSVAGTRDGGDADGARIVEPTDDAARDFDIDIRGAGDPAGPWGGSYVPLGDGLYRLSFDGVRAASAEGATGATLVSAATPAELSVGPGTTAAELQALIDAAAPGTVIRLEAGRFSFDQTIDLDRDGISVIGAGSGETIIDVEGLGQEAFAVGTGTRSGDYALAGDVPEGGTVIELTGSHDVQPGDYVYLSRENSEAFFDEIGDAGWRRDEPSLRSSIVRVESVDGNTLTLERGVHFDFPAGETTVQEIDMVEGVSLGGFSVDYGLDAADPALFENTLPEYDRNAVIEVEGTAGLQLFDIAAHDVPSLGVSVALSTDASVQAIEITGAHNKGDGGNGYALQIRDVFDSSFLDLTDREMRHSVVFASWRSAVDNTVHVDSTDRDINFHGGRDHGNLVMVDASMRDAGADGMSPTLFVNAGGTSYGAPTDPDANTVRFGEVVGTRRADEVVGYDGGARLDGRGGDDVLTGGAGNDWLIGGTGDDRLTGGGGEDIVAVEGTRDAYDLLAVGDGFELRHGWETDTLVEVEWILFADAALRLSDMSLHDTAAVDGIFTGPALWDGASGDAADAGTGPVLFGTGGNDLFLVDQPWTIVNGLGGWDTVEASVDFTMQADVEELELIGSGAIDGTGSGAGDLMLGNEARNLLRSQKGADRVWARDGDDVLRGGAAADELHGGNGDDTLKGAAGADLLEDGAGADRFVFRRVGQSDPGRPDMIVDFGRGDDVIDLTAIDADAGLAGNQAFHFGGTGPGALWQDSGALLGDVDGDGRADLLIDLGGAVVTEESILL